MKVIVQIFLVVAALIGSGVYWIATEPLPEYCNALKPAVQSMLRTRHNVNRLGLLADSIGFGSLLGTMRTSISYLTYGMVRTNTTQLTTIDTVFNKVPVRLYLPSDRQPNGPGFVFIHGGGWVMGTLDSYEGLVRKIALELNIFVVSIDYRLAPEYKFPASLDDCESATRYFIENAASWGVNAKRIAIGGDSAGGQLTVALIRRLLRNPIKLGEDPVLVRAQVVFYPFVQAANFTTGSLKSNENDPLLPSEVALRFTLLAIIGKDYFDRATRERCLLFMRHNCFQQSDTFGKQINDLTQGGNLFNINTGSATSSRSWSGNEKSCPFSDEEVRKLSGMLETMISQEFSVLMNPSFEAFPPTFIVSAENDIIRDDSFMLAERLRRAGIIIEHSHFNELYHGFMNVESDEALRQMRRFLVDTVKL